MNDSYTYLILTQKLWWKTKYQTREKTLNNRSKRQVLNVKNMRSQLPYIKTFVLQNMTKVFNMFACTTLLRLCFFSNYRLKTPHGLITRNVGFL